MYVYCVYPAMSKKNNPKNPTELSEKSMNKHVLMVFNCFHYHSQFRTVHESSTRKALLDTH